MSNSSQQQFYRFCYLPNSAQQIEDLANLARPERWDNLHDPNSRPHPVLFNYINHTFMRLMDLQASSPAGNYIYDDGKLFCFDTGLFTRNFEPIYALLLPNTPGYAAHWKLKGFFKESYCENIVNS